ncbi:MAG: hypothetical protein KJZ70_15590 [Bryobacterales bacterium]|nr:hypothetical protein [Bryobacterales bacterium]
MIVLSIVIVLSASLAFASLSALFLLKALLHAIRPGSAAAQRTPSPQ